MTGKRQERDKKADSPRVPHKPERTTILLEQTWIELNPVFYVAKKCCAGPPADCIRALASLSALTGLSDVSWACCDHGLAFVGSVSADPDL